MFFHIFKTINLKTREYYVGMHSTTDIYFGRLGEGSWDPFIGSNPKLNDSLKKYGRKVFVVQSVMCDTNEDLVKRRYNEIKLDYTDPLCLNKERNMEEIAKKISETMTGVSRSKITVPKTEPSILNIKKKQMRWINNGTEDKYTPDFDPMPENWKFGRLPRKK